MNSQWFGHRTLIAKGLGSIAGQGTTIPHAAQCSQKKFFLKKKKKKEVAQKGAGLPGACFLVCSLINQCLLSAGARHCRPWGSWGPWTDLTPLMGSPPTAREAEVTPVIIKWEGQEPDATGLPDGGMG